MDLRQHLAEQLLILRYQTGDESAFEELFQRYQPPLRYYVRRMIGGSGPCEDILQNIWLTVLRNLRKLRQPGSFRVWLYKIARTKVYQQLRRNRRFPPLTNELTLPVQASREDDFPAEAAVTIHKYLAHLGPEHREVLVLRFLEDMSYQQIAEVLDCSIGTVRSRIHYAKCSLREKFNKEQNHGQQ